MTREQQLQFCKKCTNRKLDMQVGLICSITGEKANFINECASFEVDHQVIEESDAIKRVDHHEVLSNLSDKNLSDFRLEQNYTKALIGGVVSGIIGAILWGVITLITNFQIGFMAIAIGAGVGITIRYFGKGIDQKFGIVGGSIALFSCVLGNIFSIIGYIANLENVDYIDALAQFDYSLLFPLMSETFSVIDLLFYALAAFEGYKLSFRKFTEKELLELEK